VARFDKYLLSQLVVLFGFFALVLVLVYWINRAVLLFDQLIANGHSAMVFLEFSALTLPNVIRLVLPMAAFAAAVYCGNRLASDSELVVVQTTGYSPFRLARPVLIFGALVAAMMLILTNYLVPASLTQLRLRNAEIQSNATARFLREGTFLHPAAGITFYISEIAADGVLDNMFLSDSRDKKSRTSYAARRAQFVRSDSGPKLIMFDGMVQVLRRSDNTLSTTSFSEFVFDIGPLLKTVGAGATSPAEMATLALITASPADAKAAGVSRAVMRQIGHERLSQATLSVAVALIGFSAILMGGYSRFSLWKQILAGILVLVVLKSVDNVMNDLARRDAALWPLVYLPSLLGMMAAAVMLWVSDRPAILGRRLRRVPA
jgi:lipopolysaccharide export system permease protein